MARLKAPGFEQIIRLIDIILPVDLPACIIMLPYLPIRLTGQHDTKLMGDLFCTGQKLCIPCRFIGGDQRFDTMHIGILAAII